MKEDDDNGVLYKERTEEMRMRKRDGETGGGGGGEKGISCKN